MTDDGRMSRYGDRQRHVLRFRFRRPDAGRMPALIFHDLDFELTEAVAVVDIFDKGFGALQFLDIQTSVPLDELSPRELQAFRSYVLAEAKKLYPERSFYSTGINEAFRQLRQD